jgi:hypothetical protein
MWRRVVLLWTDVSEERIASIFRIEKSASDEPAWAATTDHIETIPFPTVTLLLRAYSLQREHVSRAAA